MRLKRAPIKVFRGENWKLASDRRWEEGDFDYVPNYHEALKGFRQIGGVEHAVFHLMSGDYGAQPRELCEAVLPDEPSLEERPETGPLPYYRGDPPAGLWGDPDPPKARKRPKFQL